MSRKPLSLVLLALLGTLLLASCASVTLQDERLLAAAGFQMKLAQTPEQQAHLAALEPQRKLVPHQINGQLRFVYADAEYCKCLYAGTERAYQRYQKLSQELEVAQLDQAAAADASMDWGAWGGWGPWY